MIENWWDEVDRAILECLRDGGPMTPAELARRAGMSEGEATAFLATLIREGRVRMQLVEVDGPRTTGGGRRPTNPAAKYMRHRGL
jgi:DNA-binding Lrp family transcriptional regulator